MMCESSHSQSPLTYHCTHLGVVLGGARNGDHESRFEDVEEQTVVPLQRGRMKEDHQYLHIPAGKQQGLAPPFITHKLTYPHHHDPLERGLSEEEPDELNAA